MTADDARALFGELHMLLHTDWVGDGRPVQDETLHKDLIAAYRKRFRKRARALFDAPPTAVDDPRDGHDVVRAVDEVRKVAGV